MDPEIINAYKSGMSMTAIAREFGTYPITVKRILEKNGIKLRHDNRKIGKFYVQGGEKLIEWAKAQGRLVTQAELAKVIGVSKLSPSYFKKYPELGRYVKTRVQQDAKTDINKLYDWLKANNIPYKPKDRTCLGVTVDALLLDNYSNIAIQIAKKSQYMSKSTYQKSLQMKLARAHQMDIDLIFLTDRQLNEPETLGELKTTLERLRNK